MSLPAIMIDWITVDLPDPVGIPVNAGEIMRIDPDGEVEWSTYAKKRVTGSWDSSMAFRAMGHRCTDVDRSRHRAQWELDPQADPFPELRIEGNPAKFLQGHNLFGSADLGGLLGEVITKAQESVWPDLFGRPEIHFSQGLISRIDLTGSWLLEREGDVDHYLRALEENARIPRRGRGVMNETGTLYFGVTDKGKRAKDWQLKLYNKGREITVHRLPDPAYVVPGLVEDVNRTIRVELTLRTAELKRLGLRTVGAWTPDKVREIWAMYVGRLDVSDARLIDRGVEDLALLPDLKPRHITAIAAWKSGADMRSILESNATFYRTRKEIKDLTGIDIANKVPKSNVVPLQRVVLASPAQYPHWADHLTAALSRAA